MLCIHRDFWEHHYELHLSFVGVSWTTGTFRGGGAIQMLPAAPSPVCYSPLPQYSPSLLCLPHLLLGPVA